MNGDWLGDRVNLRSTWGELLVYPFKLTGLIKSGPSPLAPRRVGEPWELETGKKFETCQLCGANGNPVRSIKLARSSLSYARAGLIGRAKE